MAGRLAFDFRFDKPQGARARRPNDESPMRLLVIGDFSGRSGRANAAGEPLLTRKPLRIDIDNFDEVFAKVAPALELPAGPDGNPTLLQFRDLDDLHPDQLFEAAPLFASLRDLRERLSDTSTFSAAAAELRARPGGAAATAPADAAAAATPAPAEDDASTMARLLGGSLPPVASPGQAASRGVQSFIANIIAPHVLPDAPPDQKLYVASVDEGITTQMRGLLHAPAFQALESLWRGVRWMVAELELGEELQLRILDVSRDELAADLAQAGDDLSRSALYRLLVDQSPGVPGAGRSSLVAGAYSFGADEADIDLLGRLGAIALMAGSPFLGGAKSDVLGLDSLILQPDARDWPEPNPAALVNWTALRRSAMAPYIGLAMPRVLLRTPYGKKTDPCEAFPFEEVDGAKRHNAFLWGPPALACALLIGRGFTMNGWDTEPGDERDLGDLPAFSYTDDGEKHLLPVTGAYLSEYTATAVLQRGVIPLVSLRNQNAARVLRFQSIAEPAQELAGPWSAS